MTGPTHERQQGSKICQGCKCKHVAQQEGQARQLVLRQDSTCGSSTYRKRQCKARNSQRRSAAKENEGSAQRRARGISASSAQKGRGQHKAAQSQLCQSWTPGHTWGLAVLWRPLPLASTHPGCRKGGRCPAEQHEAATPITSSSAYRPSSKQLIQCASTLQRCVASIANGANLKT